MRLLGVLRPLRRKQDLSDEIEGNLALIAEEHIQAGLDAKVRHSANIEFGNSELMKQACRERMGVPLLKMFFCDLHYAIHSLFEESCIYSIHGCHSVVWHRC